MNAPPGSRNLTVGILGGMGPMATVETFRRITRGTPAHRDQEHLHVIVDSDPSVPDRTSALVHGGPSPLPALLAGAARLVSLGAEVLCVPCNTAHAFLPPVRRRMDVPIVDMLDESAAVAADVADGRPFGLLATTGTVATCLYHEVFARRGLTVLNPDPADQQRVSRGIELIKAGSGSAAEELLVPVAARLREQGVAANVLGCTEISLLGDRLAAVGPVLDALQVMVDVTLDFALRRRQGPERVSRDEAGMTVGTADVS